MDHRSELKAASAERQDLRSALPAHPAVAARVAEDVDVICVLRPLWPPPDAAELSESANGLLNDSSLIARKVSKNKFMPIKMFKRF